MIIFSMQKLRFGQQNIKQQFRGSGVFYVLCPARRPVRLEEGRCYSGRHNT